MKRKKQACKDFNQLGVPRILVVTGFMFALPAAVMFVAAGTANWTGAWIYLGVTAAFGLGMRLRLLVKAPDLLNERADSMEKTDTAAWDKYLMPLTAIAGPLVVLVVAGLDKRFAWSPSPSQGWVVAAIVVLILGCWLGMAATLANRFFSAVVRIQADRGHTVVDTGPYRVVRHPGYTGGIFAHLATPVLLGSLWAFIPTLIVCAAIVLRTVLEDRTLQHELDGYAAYALRVRFRLIPGVW